VGTAWVADAADDAWTAPGVIDAVNGVAVVPPFPRADQQIAAAVRNVLDTDPGINAANVNTNVTNGTVSLNGTVPTFYQVQRASDDAGSVAGVINVINNLTVSL